MNSQPHGRWLQDRRRSKENNSEWSQWFWDSNLDCWRRSRQQANGSTEFQSGVSASTYKPRMVNQTKDETELPTDATVSHEVAATNQPPVLASQSAWVSPSFFHGTASSYGYSGFPSIAPPTLPRPEPGVLNLYKKPSDTQDRGEHILLEYTQIGKPERYFNVGRIFVTSWVEPHTSAPKIPTLLTNHEKIVTEPRSFVVVREGPGFAVCCRFESYPTGGLLAPEISRQYHALAFLAGNPPNLSPAEKAVGLGEFPIRVENSSFKLESIYLLNLSRTYTVEHGIKAITVGRIDRKSLKKLRAGFLVAMGGEVPASETGENHPMNESALGRHGLSFPATEFDPIKSQSNFFSNRDDAGPLPLSSPTDGRADPLPQMTYSSSYDMPSDELSSEYEMLLSAPSRQVQDKAKFLDHTYSVRTTKNRKDFLHGGSASSQPGSFYHEIGTSYQTPSLTKSEATNVVSDDRFHYSADTGEAITTPFSRQTYISSRAYSQGPYSPGAGTSYDSNSTLRVPDPKPRRGDEASYSRDAREDFSPKTRSTKDSHYYPSTSEVTPGFEILKLEDPVTKPSQNRNESFHLVEHPDLLGGNFHTNPEDLEQDCAIKEELSVDTSTEKVFGDRAHQNATNIITNHVYSAYHAADDPAPGRNFSLGHSEDYFQRYDENDDKSEGKGECKAEKPKEEIELPRSKFESITEDREISGRNDADAAQGEDDEEQIKQDDRDKQYLADPGEPDDELYSDYELGGDNGLSLQGCTSYESIHRSSRQPKKISKEDIFTTMDPETGDQSLYKDRAESRPRNRSRSIHAVTNPKIQGDICIRDLLPVEDELDIESNPLVNDDQLDNEQELPSSKPYKTITSTDPQTKRDPLYKEYRVQKSAEFKKGRIFKILWSEPLGTANTGGDKSTDGTEILYIDDAKYGQRVYSTIRRFVVVKAKKGHCVCIPILTYGNQGTAKPGVKPEDHAIIYTSSQGPPNELPGEQKLLKKPIRVVLDNHREKLRPESRINYSKLYTIEHNVKVCFVGKIALEHEATFFSDFKRTFWEDM